MSVIHPTALIDAAAELDSDVVVGPYAIVEKGVRIGRATVVEAHAQILEGTKVGERCIVGRAAVLGDDPQSIAFDPRLPSRLTIGNGNRFREHVTVHRSMFEGKATVVGDDNYFMVGSHVGHDSEIGDQNIIANAVLIAGHVKIGSRIFMGGGSVFHQFIRVGDYAMIQGNSGFSKDIPPYLIGCGVNLVSGINVIGLRRAGFDSATRLEIKRAFEMLFRGGKNIAQAVAEARESSWGEAAEKLVSFIESRGDKGVCALE